MRLDLDLLQQTTASRLLRDLHDRVREEGAVDLDDPSLLAPLAELEATTGHQPHAELRRMCALLSTDELGAAVFRIAPFGAPDGGNLWEQMVARAHQDPHHGGDPTAALHGALPLGWLPRAGGRLSLSLLLEDLWGFKSGRVVGHGPPTDGAVARLELRLGTFLLRLAQDHADGTCRYADGPLEAWHTRSAWIGQLLEGRGLPDHLDDDQLLRLNPSLSDEELARVAGGGLPDRLYLLWRGWLLGEDDMVEAARAALDPAVRLESDAAALVDELRSGRDDIGPLTGLGQACGELRARMAALRAASGERVPAARLAVAIPALVDVPDDLELDDDTVEVVQAAEPTSEPEPASEPEPTSEPVADPTDPPEPAAVLARPSVEPAVPRDDSGPSTDSGGRRPGAPIPGPPPGGWPTHRDTYRSPISPVARWGLLLAGAAVVIGLLALCCGGLP